MNPFHIFRRIWCIDFEFQTIPRGNPPRVICMGAREVRTGERFERWVDDLQSPLIPGFDDNRDLVVAFFASAEMECFLALEEQLPRHVLCLHAEYRLLTNGKRLLHRDNLVGAMMNMGVTPASAIPGQMKNRLKTALLAC